MNREEQNNSESSMSSPFGGVRGGRTVTVHSPGTVANLVCGFDILGLALNAPYDVMKVKLLDGPKVIIHNKDNFNLPTEPERNVAGVVLLSVIERMENKIGYGWAMRRAC
jgi:homoserine kinase